MNLVLVAHGTRRPAGVAMIGDLAERVSALVHRTVQVAFVDVLGPTPREVLAAVTRTGQPALVVPAFLSRGFHVRTDLPNHIATSGHPDVTITPTLGPSAAAVRIVAQQLLKAGWQKGDSVILAAAGTSDPLARDDLRATAKMLSTVTASPVALAFAATGEPNVREAVAQARRRHARPVAVASYLLADGLFQQRLRNSGADMVSDPLGEHPRLARLVADRFQQAPPLVAAPV